MQLQDAERLRDAEQLRGSAQPRHAVQLWDCTDEVEPTCTQAKEDEAVQSKCARCEAEEQQPVQQGQDGARARRPGIVQREAGRGLRGAGRPLPHGERIQAAFGHHDLSPVRTRVGGAADSAARRMGALAFTSGDRIAFRSSPDLRLAAHEAAHVVQQRQGLSLPGNVGRAGDRWERHADRVADAVTDGRSAEGLLDEVARPPLASVSHSEGNEAPAPQRPVQHRLGSAPARLFEEPAEIGGIAAPQSEAAAQDGGPDGKVAAEAGKGKGQEQPAIEAAAAGQGGEAPPAGITVGGGADAAAAASPEAGAAPAPAESQAAQSGGGEINAPCYNVDPPPRPADTPEPTSDERSSESKAKPQVNFPAWAQEIDVCPAEAAMAQGSAPAPPAAGATPGACPAAGTGAGAAPAAAGAGPAAPPSAATGAPGGGPMARAELVTMKTAAPAVAASKAPPGGAPGPTEPVPAANEMDAPIAAAEAARDDAVDQYDKAGNSLGAVLGRTGTLEQGLRFAPGGDPERREGASGLLRSFMRERTGQIADAVAFAREEVPSRLVGLSEMHKASVQATIESEKSAVSARVSQARQQARASAKRARAHVEAQHTASVVLVEAETSVAIALVDAQHIGSLAEVDPKETAALADVDARFATGRTKHEDKGPEYSRKAIELGQQHAHAYERCKRSPANPHGDYEDDGFWDGCLTVRRAKAQQDTACQTAAGYRETFLRTANKKAYDLRELRKVYRCAVIAGAREVVKTLDDTHQKLVEGLGNGRRQALDGLGLARRLSLAAIDTALAATLRSLAVQETTQRQAANDTGYLNQLGIEQLAHSSAANLALGISSAMESFEQTLVSLRERVAQNGDPDPEVLRADLGSVGKSLGDGMATLMGTMRTGSVASEGSIGDMGTSAVDALLAVTLNNDELAAQAEGGFAGQMSGLMSGANRAFGKLTADHVKTARQGAKEGTTAMKQAVVGFDKALATIGTRIDEALGKSLAGLDQELRCKLEELEAQIAREAWKAAAKEQPGWKKVLAIVLIIVVIIVAAVISIVTLGAGASLFAVILVGALVGAVSAGLIQILNNWASGEEWHKGVAQAMIMGAIGGAIGGGLGFAGGALASGAAAAGARIATQFAITVTSDLVAEGLTQAVGYFAFGQEFNWQGFVMAGAMSGVSFRAHPAAPHPSAAPRPQAPHAPAPHAPAPAPHAPPPHAEAPRIEAPHAPAPRAELPAAARGIPPEPPAARPGAPEAAPKPTEAPHPIEAPGPARVPEPDAAAAAGAAGGRRAAVTQVAGGALVGFGLEALGSWVSGEKFDLSRAASAAASGAVGARAARRGAPAREPKTRIGRAAARLAAPLRPAAERLRAFDPGRVGERLGRRLETVGGRAFGATPEAVEAPTGGRPAAAGPPAPVRPPETPGAADITRVPPTDAEIDASLARAQAGPMVRVHAGAPGADLRAAPLRAPGEPTLPQRQRAGALHDEATALAREADGLLDRAIARDAEAGLADLHNPRRARALRDESARLLERAADLETRAGALRQEADEFASGRRSATEDLPGTEDVEAMFAGLVSEAPGLVRVPLSDVERNPALLQRLVRPLLSGEGGGRMVFRVESERSRSLVHVDARGNVRVEGGAAAHLNFGSFERALEFVMQSSQGNARIIRFEVDEAWVRSARSAAIPEHETAAQAGRQPRLVDVRFAHDQLEVPASLINELNRFIVPGSGVVHEIPARRPPAETTATAVRSTNDIAQVVAQRNVVVGEPLATEAQARTVLRSVMQDESGALRPVGVSDLPEGFRPTSVEWGLGELPDGRFVVIRGGPGSVDWSKFPGVHSVGHTHPSSNVLHGGEGPGSEMPFRDALATDLNRTALLPSGQDMAYLAGKGIDTHTVFTPFEVRANGRIANAVPGSGLPRVEIEVRGARLEGYLGTLPTYRAEMIARSSTGELLWQGTVHGMPHPYLGQILDLRPPPGLRPSSPEAARLPPDTGGGTTGMGRRAGGDPAEVADLKGPARSNGIIKGDHEWAAFLHLHQQLGGTVRDTHFRGKKLIVEYADGSQLIASEIAHRVDFEFYRPGEHLLLQEIKGGGKRWMDVDENSAAIQLGETLRTQASRELPTYEGVPPSRLPEFLLDTRLGSPERLPLTLQADIRPSRQQSQPLLAVVLGTGDPPTILRHYPIESTHLEAFLEIDLSRVPLDRWEDLYTQALGANDHTVGDRVAGRQLGSGEEVRLIPIHSRSSEQ